MNLLRPRNDQRTTHVIPIDQGSAPHIKPENAPELASRYLDVPDMPWQEAKFPGIRIKVLYAEQRGIMTALFKLDPGAAVPLHEHTEGVCHPGQFVWRPAGNCHEAVAPNGAIILGFFLKPNRFRCRLEILHGGSAVGFTAPTPADHGLFQA